MSNRARFVLGAVVAFLGLVAANVPQFRRPVTCFDCFLPYGVPFTFYREDGFAGDGGLVWLGLACDLLVVLLAGLAIGKAWSWFSARRLKRSTLGRLKA